MFQPYSPIRALHCAGIALFLALALEGLWQIAFGSFSTWPSHMAASSLYTSVVFLLTFALSWYSNFRAALSPTIADVGKIPAFDAIAEHWRKTDILQNTVDLGHLRQAEERLQESEEKYRSLVATIPEVVWKTDAKGNVIFVSPQVEALLGHSADEFRQKGDSLWFNSVHPDDKEKVGQAFKSLINEGEPYDIECRARKKNGEWFWAHDRAVATSDSNGFRVATGLISDITVRKAKEESENRYRSLFENMLEGLAHCEMLVDNHGCPIDFVYLAVNSAFGKLTGLSNVVGKKFSEIFPGGKNSQPELFERYSRVALTSQPERFEIEIKALGMWFSISAYGVGYGCFVAAFDNITERKRAERATNLLAAIVDSSEDAIISKGLDGIISSWNRSAERLFGYAAEETIGRHISLIIPADRPQEEAWILGQLNRVEQFEHFETVRVRKDGTLIDISVTVSPIRDASGRIVGVSKLARSITERKQAEQALRQAEEKYRAIFEAAVVGIFRSTPDGRYVEANPAMAQMLGYDSPHEMIASITDISRQLYVDPNRREELKRLLREQTTVKNFECAFYRKDGSKMWFSANMRTVSENGLVVGYEGTNEDITDRKVAEERVQYLAYYDALTGLPNRTLLRDRLTKALADARRQKYKIALLFLDLDRFKDINDSLGHAAGDLFLQEVAERLKKFAREQDTVARLGGDEFLIMLTHVKDVSDAAVAAERLMDAMSAEFVIQGHPLHVSCSIGISIFPEHGADCETLIKNADAAMYSAKAEGRNNFRFFNKDMNAQAVERLTLESGLRSALAKEQLFLMYQPQMDIATGRITGLEALLRWQHPELGLVPPDRFIRIAENSGLIVPIGEWVLRTACSQARKWQDEGLSAVPVAVNVSAVQFRQEGFCQLIRKVLSETGLAPQHLELELTESLLLANADMTFSVLQELTDMGVTLAIDDFGTGYSNFTSLRQFGVSKLKIDRSFIRDVAMKPDDAAITTAIISMAKSLNLKVIAEGVENEAQMSFLRAHQCDEIQGYYFSRPLAVDKVDDKLRSNVAETQAEHKPTGDNCDNKPYEVSVSLMSIGLALLVSADPVTIQQFSLALRELSISPDACQDAASAALLLKRRKFDAVIVDLQLGEQSGHILDEARLSPSNRTAVTFGIGDNDAEVTSAFRKKSQFVFERPLSAQSIRKTLRPACGLILRERRRYFRCPASVPVTVLRTNMPEVRCHSVNISEGGMALSTLAPISIGEEVQVQFTLPEHEVRFSAKSTVCWWKTGHLGVRFVSLSQEHKSYLQVWLSRKLEEMLPELVASQFQKWDKNTPQYAARVGYEQEK